MYKNRNDSGEGNEQPSRPGNRSGTWELRVLGYAGLLLAVGLQLPLLIPAFEHGIDYAPGRTGLLSTWVSLVILMDVAVFLWWSCHRLSNPVHAFLPGAIALISVVAAGPLALVLRALLIRHIYS